MKDLLFNRQFLLTKATSFPYSTWNKFPISDYTLYTHPNLLVTYQKRDEQELYLIGYAFDYRTPAYTNEEIVNSILDAGTDIKEIIEQTDNYTGQFVILYKKGGELFLFNDACAQREVYYTQDFAAIGSQSALIEKVCDVEAYKEGEEAEFYHSPQFQGKRLFIGAETHKKNVYHLRPNHLLNFSTREQLRFFPDEVVERKPLKKVAADVAEMLRGYLQAVAMRYRIALPVTAGYDSRVLFGASLGLDCRYFVFKHNKLNESHPDIYIPKKLLSVYDKELEVISYKKEVDPELVKIHQESIDFYRPANTAITFNGYRQYFKDYIVLNGNLSEIARSFYGKFGKITGDDLAFFNGLEAFPYARKVYQNWLQDNKDIFQKNGYPLLDMYYWEEKMGNWAAKGKTEALLGTEFFSPFNSRKMIALMLSVDSKYRDFQRNKLFKQILLNLSPDLLKIPVNPDRKTKVIIAMKRLGIYNIYRRIGLKYRILKF